MTVEAEALGWSKADDSEAARSPHFVEDVSLSGWRFVLKDIIERGLALLVFVVLAPLLLMLCLAIRIRIGAPVFVVQHRVGLHGRHFKLFKFRTLLYPRNEADESGRLVSVAADGWTLQVARDPRLSPLGHFLRSTGLDELPQLWNVIRGDMSLVGPRPRFFSELQQWESEDRRILLVKPGLTGLAQVAPVEFGRRGAVSLLDHYYVDNWSLGLDFALLLRTVTVNIRGRDTASGRL